MIFTAWCWLTVLAVLLLRQVSISRRSPLAFDWYSLLSLYLFASYIFPVLAIISGVEFPAHSYVNTHPGAAEAPAGAAFLLTFVLSSMLGYSLLRGRPLSLNLRSLPDKRLVTGLILIISAATLAWIVAYGGIVQAVTSVMAIRFGRVSSDTSVPWFLGLTKASWFSAVVAFDALFQARRARKGSQGTTAAYVLLGVSVVALLLRGSRGAIGNVLISIVLYMYARRSVRPGNSFAVGGARKRRMALAVITVTAVTVVILFKPLMGLIRVAKTEDSLVVAVEYFQHSLETSASSEEGRLAVVGKVASEFSHFPILTSLAFEYDQAHPETRDYGRDLYIGLGKLLPASIYEPVGFPLSYRTTQLILGTWESQVPPGILAWLLLSSGPLGILFGSLICGALLAVSERVAVQVLQTTWWSEAGYISFGMTVAAGIIGGAPGDAFRILGTMVAVLVAALLLGSAAELLPRRGGDLAEGSEAAEPAAP